MSNYDSIRRDVLDSCRWLAEHGYLGELSSGGNISARVPGADIAAITPSGRSYLSLNLNDICVIDFDQNFIEGSLSPSIEAGMHIGVYQNRPDVNAVRRKWDDLPVGLNAAPGDLPSAVSMAEAGLGSNQDEKKEGHR